MICILIVVLSIISITKSYKSNYKIQLQSYIDSNQDIENINSRNINSGLGNEKIIYYDDDIIVVDKPINTQTAPGFVDSNSLANVIQKEFNIERIDHMIVHRLDYSTSGVLIYARNIDSLRSLHKQFRQKKSIYKRYCAIVNGRFDSFEGEIDLPISKDLQRGPPLQSIDPINGKQAITLYQMIEFTKDYSYVHLHPYTGRTHQLRLHMASINKHILGDFFYSPPDIYLKSNRLLLHAEELRLKHPRTNQDIRLLAKCPFKLSDII